MDWGIKNRLGQLFQDDGHCFFLPIDHGYFQGPTHCLERPGETIEPLLPYCDALMLTRGVLRSTIPSSFPRGIVLRASGGPSILKELSNEQIGRSIGGSKQYIGRLIRNSLEALRICIETKGRAAPDGLRGES